MTGRMKKFALFYHESGNIVQSALKAGYSERYASSDACKILENPSVIAYIRELSEAEQDARIMSAKERKALLSDLAKSPDNAPTDRIRAIDTLNKMTGEYVTHVDATVHQSEKLADILSQLGGDVDA